MTEKRIPPIHPGEILLEEFQEPMGISQYKLSKDIHVQQTRISEIIKGKRSITADTAMRLGIYFPEIPGANGQGLTKEVCLKSLSNAIKLILEDRRASS